MSAATTGATATSAATACVSTAHASRYLQQLCKHWSHNLPVEFDATTGRVVFPRDARGADWPADGEVRFAAHPDRLDVTIEASSAAHLEALQAAVARHLDRFAFREAPLTFEWRQTGLWISLTYIPTGYWQVDRRDGL